MCYVLGMITGILFLVLEPYNKNPIVRFHAMQSILLNVAVVLIWVVISAVSGGLALILSPLFGPATIVLFLFMAWKAYQKEKLVLPVIGPWAEKQR